ncbi:MAG: 50S ribosomal protein L10 [Planctomycetes bacterium]|nr:50S ribosomal protein L10 [Planctomycetota bacterium]
MKTAIVDEFVATFDGVDSAVVVNPGKLTVAESEQLRTRFRSEGIKFLHVRNNLAAVAFAKTGVTGLERILKGPAGIAFGGEGAIAISKIVVDEAKKIKNLSVVGGFIDGELLDAEGVDRLSQLPGKKELQSMVLQGLFGPVSDFHRAMGDLLTEVHGLIEALQEKGGAQAWAWPPR